MRLRRPDWRERLLAYIAERELLPFQYGKRANDCSSFANGAVIAMTGDDAMRDIANYRGAKGAAAVMVATLAEFLDRRFQRVPIGLAHCGDLGIATCSGRETIVVVEGVTIAGPGADGLQRLPRDMLAAAWRV